MHTELPTQFLSAERIGPTDLAPSVQTACNHPLVTQLMTSLEATVLVLNEHRQIIAANDGFKELSEGADPSQVLGLRPGESLTCIHALDAPGGCGTEPACRSCGAACAVLESSKNNALAHRECSITVYRRGGVLDTLSLDVHAAPLRLEGKAYTLLTLLDIRSKKRRESMQRAFFHDILNSIGGLTGLCHIMETAGGATDPSLFAMAKQTAEYLAESVYSQRDMLAMEDGFYEIQKTVAPPEAVLEKVKAFVSLSGLLHNRHLRVENRAPESKLKTDVTLLLRVLINMVKNGLEAVPHGERVDLVYTVESENARFEVINPGNISEDAVHRIFEKNYSTKKGVGRGIGTFSIKLLGERFLGGNVGFDTGNGRTRFYLLLPSTIVE